MRGKVQSSTKGINFSAFEGSKSVEVQISKEAQEIKILTEGKPFEALGLQSVSVGHKTTLFSIFIPLITVKPATQAPVELWQISVMLPWFAFFEALLWTALLSLVMWFHDLIWSKWGRRDEYSLDWKKTAVLTIFVAIVMGAVVWFKLSSKIEPDLTSPFQTNLVDQQGRSLSGKVGGVYVHFNPFTLYRNATHRADYYQTNKLGYRLSGGESKAAPAAVMLGASSTFGWGIRNNTYTFTAHLNRLNPAFQFHNAGVIAWHIGQEFAEMVHYADRLKPKLYVSFSGYNEFFFHGHKSVLGANSNITKQFEERLRLLVALQGQESKSVVTVTQEMASDEEIIENYLQTIKKMSDFSRMRGARFLLVLQPELGGKKTLVESEEAIFRHRKKFFAANAKGDFTKRYQTLVTAAMVFCKQQGIEVLNLTSGTELQTSKDELFVDWVHPNEKGHEIIARLVQAKL